MRLGGVFTYKPACRLCTFSRSEVTLTHLEKVSWFVKPHAASLIPPKKPQVLTAVLEPRFTNSDRVRLRRALEQCPAVMLHDIEELNKRVERSLEESRNRSVGFLPEYEMIVIRHEAIGYYRDFIFFGVFV